MTYKATTEDVLATLGNHPIIKGEIIRDIANKHGLGDVTGSQQPVSAYSVTKVLKALMDTGEVIKVNGDHWSISWSAGRGQTFYLARSARAAIAMRLDEAERQTIRYNAEVEATATILARHQDEWVEIRDEIIAAVAQPDHQSLWEDS